MKQGYERENWIDIARGIGILLVILGHMSVARRAIYSFHMPLFFFISGFLYKKRNFSALIRYESLNLVIPYCLWGGGLSGAMYIIARMGIVSGRNEFSDFRKQLINILHGGDCKNIINAAPALWFLIALAGIIILYWCIEQIINSIYLKCIVVFFIALIGVILLREGIICPFNINVMLVVLPFFFWGKLCRKHRLKYLGGG